MRGPLTKENVDTFVTQEQVESSTEPSSALSSPRFVVLDPDENPFLPRNQDAFDLLQSMTSVELGRSVPYIKIWQVNSDGRPTWPESPGSDEPQLSKTISFLTVEPPRFGNPVGVFSERPAVSLEKVAVKNNLSLGGPIIYREITIDFCVSRPQLVFDETNDDYLPWANMILPGTMFAMRYGWTGGSTHPLLNGQGVFDRARNIVEGRKLILFVVARYNFTINNDGSLNVTMHAYENADNILNKIGLSHLRDDHADSNSAAADSYMSHRFYGIEGVSTSESTKSLQNIQTMFNDLFKRYGIDVPKHGKFIKLQHVLDFVIAPIFAKALANVGYRDCKFFVGRFNSNIGQAHVMAGGSKLADASIGEFLIPQNVIREVLGQISSQGGQLNVYNFFWLLVEYVMRPDNWSHSLTESQERSIKGINFSRGKLTAKDLQDIQRNRYLSQIQNPPELKIKTVGHEHTAYVYIYDMKRSYRRFDDSDRLDPRTARDKIAEKLKNKGIPLVSFRNGMSFIKESSFSVEQDQQVQSVLISRALEPSRYDLVKTTHAERMTNTVDPRKLLYSSAILGTITCVGNFVFDSLVMLWLEFGIRRWDGLFFVLEKEDILNREDFTSVIKLRSSGDDPLNTQGRLVERAIDEVDREIELQELLSFQPSKKAKRRTTPNKKR